MIKLDEKQYEENAVCIPNIGRKEQRKRFTVGLVSLVIGMLIGAFLIFNDWAWWTRFALFLPFFAGFSGIFQAREKT